jgi:hypothetical protein
MGRPHASLSAAHDYAHGVELHMAASRPINKRVAESPIAGWHGAQKRQHRGRGGRGVHHSSGSSSASGSGGKGAKARKHPHRFKGGQHRSRTHSPHSEREHVGGRAHGEHGGSGIPHAERGRDRGSGSGYGRGGSGSGYGRGGGRSGGSGRGYYHGSYGGRGGYHNGRGEGYAAFAEQPQRESAPAPVPAGPLQCCPGCGTTTATHAVFCPLLSHRA